MESVSGRAREHATLPPSVPLTAAPGPACVYFSGEVLSSGPRAAICTAWLALWEASGLFQHALPEFGACFLFSLVWILSHADSSYMVVVGVI